MSWPSWLATILFIPPTDSCLVVLLDSEVVKPEFYLPSCPRAVTVSTTNLVIVFPSPFNSLIQGANVPKSSTWATILLITIKLCLALPVCPSVSERTISSKSIGVDLNLNLNGPVHDEFRLMLPSLLHCLLTWLDIRWSLRWPVWVTHSTRRPCILMLLRPT
jgi:hypothetical protein